MDLLIGKLSLLKEIDSRGAPDGHQRMRYKLNIYWIGHESGTICLTLRKLTLHVHCAACKLG